MKPKVREQNEIISVHVLYGNEERWKSVKDRGTLRDKNGSIILPMIVIKEHQWDLMMPCLFHLTTMYKENLYLLFVQVVDGVKTIGMIDLLF